MPIPNGLLSCLNNCNAEINFWKRTKHSHTQFFGRNIEWVSISVHKAMWHDNNANVIVGEAHSIIATVFGYYENPHTADLDYGSSVQIQDND